MLSGQCREPPHLKHAGPMAQTVDFLWNIAQNCKLPRPSQSRIVITEMISQLSAGSKRESLIVGLHTYETFPFSEVPQKLTNEYPCRPALKNVE